MSIVARRAPRGGRAALATALVAIGTCASTLALANLLNGSTSRGTIWFAVLLLAAIVAGVRALTRTWFVPTLVGLVVTFVGVVLRYGAPPGRLQLVPDLDAWERTRGVWSDGLSTIDTSVVPMDVTRPVELVILAGALLVFLAADLLAVGLGRAGWAGLAYLAMWIPGVSLGFGAGGWPLFWTGAAYLLLLAVTAAPHAGRTERGRLASVAVWSTMAVVVGALVLGPLLTALPGWSAVRLPSFGGGAAGPVQLSDQLDLRHSLGQRTGQTVLTYSVSAVEAATEDVAPSPSASAPAGPAVTAGNVGPLRAFTLTEFDGRSWTPTPPTSTADVSAGTLVASDPALDGEAPSATRGTLAQVDVKVGALDETRLPIAIFPRAVDAPGSWQYDAARDEVFGRRATVEGLSYSMVVELPNLTAEELAGASTPPPADAAESGVLDVPDTSHRDDIAALAQEITADATTPYQQAMALQTYFRSTANFTYDVRVAPARTDDAVWDFLQDTHGYCVQFATSMTIMARTLGIPARVGIGFLPGTSDGGDSFVVTGKQAHAWPELYFGQELGWVRFEPTPAVQTGAPPAWSDPFRAAPVTPGQDQIPTNQATEPGSASTQDPGTSTTTSRAQTPTEWVPVAVTVVVVLLLAGVAGFVALSHRRRRRVDLTPEAAWARLRRALGSRGIRWSDATTPRAVVDLVQEQLLDQTGSVLDGTGATSLVALSQVVEQDRYAPRAPETDPAELETWVRDVTDAVGILVSDRSRRGASPSAPRVGS